MKKSLLLLCFSLIFIAFSCKKEDDPDKQDNDINLFSISDDKALGADFAQQIESPGSGYDVLDSAQFPEAYGHLYRIRNEILNSGKVRYEQEFLWRTRIIQDDATLNAFCTPGGYIYVYTGLIKYLDTEAQLAGVMAHEIAHADRRHSTDQLTKRYGLSVLLSLVFGEDPNLLAEIAANLVNLSFSREDESEADEYSVIYLYPTVYDARGAAGFFQKLEAQGTSSPPEFLSTHPAPDNRIENILSKWEDLGGESGGTFEDRYLDFKASLP